MKISEQWLREWTNPELTTDELSHLITMAGLEVDGVEPVAGSDRRRPPCAPIDHVLIPESSSAHPESQVRAKKSQTKQRIGRSHGDVARPPKKSGRRMSPRG